MVETKLPTQGKTKGLFSNNVKVECQKVGVHNLTGPDSQVLLCGSSPSRKT